MTLPIPSNVFADGELIDEAALYTRIFQAINTIYALVTASDTQFGSFTSGFTGVSATSGTLVFPTTFNTPPIVVGQVQIGAATDLLLNWTTPPTVSTVGWRLVQKSGATVVGPVTATVHWIAIGT